MKKDYRLRLSQFTEVLGRELAFIPDRDTYVARVILQLSIDTFKKVGEEIDLEEQDSTSR